MGNFKVYTTFNKSCQTAPSAWKCPKTQFWGPLINWKNPLQGPTHTLTPSSMNTQNRSKTTYRFIMACIEFYATGQNSITLKSKDLATHGFQKNPDTPTKTHWSWAQFQKGQPPAKLRMLFLLTSGLESFSHKSTPSDRPWIEGYCPKF